MKDHHQVVLTVIALSIAAITIHQFVAQPTASGGILREGVTAKDLEPDPGTSEATRALFRPVEVPKAWGKFVGTFISSQLRFVTFEATDGTLRTALVCPRCDVVRK
jgi:hypothetical protein